MTVDMFLINLSHRWGSLVLGATLALGLALFIVAKVYQGFGRTIWTKAALAVVGLAFAVSLLLTTASVLHVGCARFKAKDATCLSRLKQLGVGAVMYAQDYDERLPPGQGWLDRVEPYARRAETHGDTDFRCPDPNPAAWYGMNGNLGGLGFDRIDAPAESILFFDADVLGRSFVGGAKAVAWRRHGEHPNFAFADGHARGMSKLGQTKLVWSASGR